MADEKKPSDQSWEEKYHELKRAYEEFQASSKEFETALESEVASASKIEEQLLHKIEKVKEEYDKHRATSEEKIQVLNHQVAVLHNRFDSIATEAGEYKNQVRKLEQEKDDLERNLRVSAQKVIDQTEALESAMEENIIVRHELDEERSTRQESELRLKDQIRELTNDIQVVKARLEESGVAPPMASLPQSTSSSKSPPSSPGEKKKRSSISAHQSR